MVKSSTSKQSLDSLINIPVLNSLKVPPLLRDFYKIVEFVRAGKHNFSFSFTLSEDKAAVLEALCEYPSGELEINGESYEGRLRGFKADLIYLSQWGNRNLYNCSCEFIEA